MILYGGYMFVARKKEIRELNKRYDSGKFECMIIYGRRRVGKTTLINEFCRDKDTIYFPALKDTVQGNLESLSRAVHEYREPDAVNAPVYPTFQAAFEEIGKIASQKRIVFVIDEYPCLAKADESISSRLQHLIDLDWLKGRMFLILCGSSVSFMEDEVLSYESPLFGRRTGQIRLQPLSYRDTALFNQSLDPVTNAEIYGITGGIPLYVNKLDVKKNLDRALLDNFFNPASYLFEEPENLLKQELREPSVYNAVIKSVAEGATKLNEIASFTGVETASCTTYIKTLTNLGILKKETPFREKEGRRSIYTIADPFFRFWYRFVPRNIGAIQTGRIERTYETAVKEYLHSYMGPVFEEMCSQYLMQYAQDLPIELNNIGRWWGTDPKTKKQIEIDLIGEPVRENRNHAAEYIAASCKFRNRPASLKDMEELKEYSMVYSPDAVFHYYIFSVSGFKEDLIQTAKKENVKLISIEDMYRC